MGSLGRESGPVFADAGTGSAGADASDSGGTVARREGTKDRLAEARALCDQAKAALEESEYERAYELTSAALKLAKTVRAYTLRARAEQRLGRVDDALRSLDAAVEITPNAGEAWEQRGRILWAARRRDEARAAFSRFLELSPNSPRAEEIQRLLDEPR